MDPNYLGFVRLLVMAAAALAACDSDPSGGPPADDPGSATEDTAGDPGEDAAEDGPPSDAGEDAALEVPGEDPVETPDVDATEDATADGPSDAEPDLGPLTCRPCLGPNECGLDAACVQYAGSDYCAATCNGELPCPDGETCLTTLSDDGQQVSVCVPSNGTCAGAGCGECAEGTSCEIATGTCQPDPADVSPVDAGGDGDACTPTYLPPEASACCSACDPDDADCQANGCFNGWWCDPEVCRCKAGPDDCSGDAGSGTCSPYVLPGTDSCCSSCTPGSGDCQANGCYGGWWCNADSCHCHAPLASCDTGDAGTGVDSGEPPLTGSVDADGGTVSRLYFAVVGDTRPALNNDTAGYPTAIIDQIYERIEAMSPRPQFVVTTGDYIFASPTGPAAAAQLALYRGAMDGYSGVVFPALGNHECNGYTNSNCAGSGATDSFRTFMDMMLDPIGQSLPYYSISIDGSEDDWTAKFVFVACNAWNATQRDWLQTELDRATTYTFVINHERLGTTAPCDADLESILDTADYTMFIVGHTHTYSHYGRQLIEGVGGAPITGSANYGWATVEQLSAGGVRVTQYDYDTGLPVDTYTLE